MTADTAEEAPRKGRSNAILTYETVEELKLGIQRVDLKMDRLNEKMADIGTEHDDHELRIRVLELALAGSSSTTGFAKWLWQAAIPTVAVVVSLLAYINH